MRYDHSIYKSLQAGEASKKKLIRIKKEINGFWLLAFGSGIKKKLTVFGFWLLGQGSKKKLIRDQKEN